MRKLPWLLVALLLISFASCNTEKAAELKNACKELDNVDLKMLKIIDDIRDRYKTEDTFLKRFENSQIYWIQYKDRHVRALYPGKKEDYKKLYGTEYNNCKCKEWVRLTKLRIEEIERWIKPKAEGDLCPSSIQ